MRRALSILVIAGCGGGKTAPNEPATPTETVVEAPVAKAEEPPAPAPAPPPPEPVKPKIDLQAQGPVAGLEGYSVKIVADKKFCGGGAVVTTRGKKVGKDDQPIAAVFAIEYPKGLDFSEKKKEASFKKFDAWVKTMQETGNKARTHYEGMFAKAADSSGKAVALARIIQAQTRIATVLLHAEVPVDLRTGDMVEDKTNVFCDRMNELVGPIEASTQELVTKCASLENVTPGWWTEVCTIE